MRKNYWELFLWDMIFYLCYNGACLITAFVLILILANISFMGVIVVFLARVASLLSVPICLLACYYYREKASKTTIYLLMFIAFVAELLMIADFISAKIGYMGGLHLNAAKIVLLPFMLWNNVVSFFSSEVSALNVSIGMIILEYFTFLYYLKDKLNWKKYTIPGIFLVLGLFISCYFWIN